MKKTVRLILNVSLSLILLISMTVSASAEWQTSGDRVWNSNNSERGYSVGWEKIDGYWYLFDKDGWRLTGWQKSDGKWYYLSPSGSMMTHTWVGGYYLTDTGEMAASMWIDDVYVGVDGKKIPDATHPVASQVSFKTLVDMPSPSRIIIFNVKNNSPYSLNLWVRIRSYDASFTLVSTKRLGPEKLGPGEEIPYLCVVNDHYEYDIVVTDAWDDQGKVVPWEGKP